MDSLLVDPWKSSHFIALGTTYFDVMAINSITLAAHFQFLDVYGDFDLGWDTCTFGMGLTLIKPTRVYIYHL